MGSRLTPPAGSPYSLLSWLPFLWSQVLFPGRSDTPTAPRWTSLLILIVGPGLLLYPCLTFPLFEPDEGRYAQIPREMFQNGEWVVPLLLQEPYLDKPPLMYWLVQVSYRCFGVSDGAARLVPALALHAAILFVYGLGRRQVGERAAFWGALLLSVAPGFLSMGRLLILDGLLTLWAVVAVLSGFEAVRGERLRWGWWVLMSLACGLGVLTKGPIAVLLVLPPLWLHLRLTRSPIPIPWTAGVAFAALAAAVNLPWYAAACVRMPGFAYHFLYKHNLMRFLQPFDHLEPVWYYAPIVLLGMLPGTLLLWPFARFLLSGEEDAEKRTPELGFYLLSGSWCVLFFSLSGSKLPTYVLPAFPVLALALGTFLASRSWAGSRWVRGLMLGSFLLLALAHHVLIPWYAWYRSPVRQLDVLVKYCGDPEAPVVCFPRQVDSVAFYLGRSDLRDFRSKEVEELRTALRAQPRTVVLCTHRHTLSGLRELLPPELCITETVHFGLSPVPGLPDWLADRLASAAGETALGLCDLAVVEKRRP